jgi:hypothetical protein
MGDRAGGCTTPAHGHAHAPRPGSSIPAPKPLPPPSTRKRAHALRCPHSLSVSWPRFHTLDAPSPDLACARACVPVCVGACVRVRVRGTWRMRAGSCTRPRRRPAADPPGDAGFYRLRAAAAPRPHTYPLRGRSTRTGNAVLSICEIVGECTNFEFAPTKHQVHTLRRNLNP